MYANDDTRIATWASKKNRVSSYLRQEDERYPLIVLDALVFLYLVRLRYVMVIVQRQVVGVVHPAQVVGELGPRAVKVCRHPARDGAAVVELTRC